MIGENTKGSHYYNNNDNYADSPALSLETCDSPVSHAVAPSGAVCRDGICHPPRNYYTRLAVISGAHGNKTAKI